MRPTVLAALTALAWSVVPSNSATPPAFEAASIKPAAQGAAGSGINRQPARIRIINSSLKFCIEVGWDVKGFQVAGGPAWIDAERYDIDAVAAKPFSEEEYRTMVQVLLADRFGLAIHRETREKAGFALVTERSGAKLPPPTESPEIYFSRTASGDRTLTATSISLKQLAGSLASMLGEPIVDQTGIEGKFNVSMQWTPDSTAEPLMTKSGMPVPPPPADAASGPSIFTALREKLGLKLEARKVPVEIIVIDRANRPSEN